MRRIQRSAVQTFRPAFTLVELLVVIAIIGLLLATLLPSLRASREQARTAACAANLRSLLTGAMQYSIDNRDFIVPSYNMQGVSLGTNNPLDGWGPILDKGGYVFGDERLAGHSFVCPDTMSIPGIVGTQTGGDPDNPRGYMDWPAVLTLSQNFASTIPSRGFNKLIRVSYWINGDNPIGRPLPIRQGIHYTGSVGYGPDFQGQRLQNYRLDLFPRSSRVIALSDGIYAGMQEATRDGTRDSRIAYRHTAFGQEATNTAFADGHVSPILGDRFPRKFDGPVTREQAMDDNLGGGPTIYSDPDRFLLQP